MVAEVARANNPLPCFSKVLDSVQVGEIARALVAEGCGLPSVATLARTTRARDVDALALERTPLLQAVQPYRFKIPVINPSGVGIVERDQDMVLPHELFNVIWEQQPAFFHRTFATAGLSEFWARQDEARLARHPVVGGLGHDARARMVPVQLYGDGVAVCRTYSCLVLLWKSSASFRLPAIESLLPCSSTLTKHTDRRSLEEVFAVLRWSLSVLQSGVWPDSDYKGRAWAHLPGQEHRQARAGTPLAGGFSAVFWDVVADWEFLSKMFGFDVWKVSYNCSAICFRCPACFRGRHTFKLLDVDAEMFSPEFARTLDDLLAGVVPAPQLAQIDGFELQHSVLWDWMHVSPLGIGHKACGACLVELSVEGRFGNFGGAWKLRVGLALKRAHGDFCTWCKGAGLTHSQQMFTAASLSVADGADYVPHLKGKAHNLMCVTKWLAEIVRDDDSTIHRRNRGRVMWSLALLDSLFSSAGQWFTDDEVAQVEFARRTLFPAWRTLAVGKPGFWPALPKHHAAIHMLADAVRTRRNPGGFWCFTGEHLMGLCKKSLSGNFQRGVDGRVVRAALYRLGVAMRDFSP